MQPGLGVGHVTGLGRQGGGVLDYLQAADEQVAEAVRSGAGREAVAVLQLIEDRARLGPDVEVAAEDQRGGSRERRGALGGGRAARARRRTGLVLTWRLATQRPDSSRVSAMTRVSGLRVRTTR